MSIKLHYFPLRNFAQEKLQRIGLESGLSYAKFRTSRMRNIAP